MPAPLRACLCFSFAAFSSGARVSVNELDKLNRQAKLDCVLKDEAREPNDMCTVENYYDGVTMADVQALHDRVTRGHRVLPYGKNNPDDPEYKCANVWNGVEFLDENKDDTGEDGSVDLLYSKYPAKKASKSESFWNREHVWPKSYGASCKVKTKYWSNGRKGVKCKKKKKYDALNGPFTDLHHLFPSHSGVNGDRGSQYFDECDDNVTSQACEYDHHTEDGYTAEEKDAGESVDDRTFWQPPKKSRGVVARALFYMALRYDGEEPHTFDLTLTDHPTFCSEALGKLSVLKKWHEEFAPTEEEVARNEKACWLQGNRNPFVDHPELVDELFQPNNPSLVTEDPDQSCRDPKNPTNIRAKMCDKDAGWINYCTEETKPEPRA